MHQKCICPFSPEILFFFFFFTLVTGPRRSLSLRLSDTRVYEPQIRARLGTTAHFCKVASVLNVLYGEPSFTQSENLLEFSEVTGVPRS